MAGVYSYPAVRAECPAAAQELRNLQLLEGKDEAVVEAFLLDWEVETLSGISLSLLVDYRTYIDDVFDDRVKKAHFGALLETAALGCLKPGFTALDKKIDELFPHKSLRFLKNKVKMFLMVMGIHEAGEITFFHRLEFNRYLDAIGFGGIQGALKLLDRIKLSAVREENELSPWRERKIPFKEEVLYLGYHPDYRLAMEFYYVQDKEELVFDFSLPAPEKIKRQVFAVLDDALSRPMSQKLRREKYLVPLKKLYLFCIDRGISDLEMLLADDVAAFRKSLEGKSGTKTDVYMQIIYSVRRFLFLFASRTNWDANVWFLDRFSLKNDRANPSGCPESFRFDKIRSDRNRFLMKQYMKCEIGIGSRSVATILSKYNNIMPFLYFLDKEGIDAGAASAEDFDRYALELDRKQIQESSYNVAVGAIGDFYRYLRSKGLAGKVPFEAAYYKKKTVYVHKDRSVSKEDQMSLLGSLKHFPEDLRLMCLIIWAAGIRVSEVCTLKGDAFSFDGEDAYLGVFQQKMNAEKKIPIPGTLGGLMKKYIHKNGIGPDEYIFKNKRGGAYQAATFRKKVQLLCEKYGVGDSGYIFRPHDFRHLVGTSLFDEGASLMAIRDYHGHRDADMTRKYIDYMPRKVDRANDDYFKNSESLLGEGWDE